MDNKTDPQQDGLPPFHFRCQHGQVHSIEEGCNCESSTIEDKLKDLCYFTAVPSIKTKSGCEVTFDPDYLRERIQAIITTETTNARIDEHNLTKRHYHPDNDPAKFESFLADRTHALQKEQP